MIEFDPLLEQLKEWLSIPSVSTGGGDRAALVEAAEWVLARVEDAGGEAQLLETEGNPLALGEFKASQPNAPTVLVYGHYDVQGVGPAELWETPPFEPTIRNNRIYARGACDDKGNFLPLLYVACELARENRLPVNVRIVVEGEEEVGSERIGEWLANDERGADCAIAFDTTMVDLETPALTLGTRGIVSARVEVRTAAGDLHSGLYGGPTLNAIHALHTALAGALARDGTLPETLRAGIKPPNSEEIEGWKTLPPGEDVLAKANGKPAYAGATEEFYLKTVAEPALDINGILGGAPGEARTIIPASATARLSLRTVAGQHSRELAGELERLLCANLPAGADLTFSANTAEPSLFDANEPALKLARTALHKACGREPVLMRSGGTLPILAALSTRGIPTIFSGFGLPSDNFHAPNECFGLENLRLGMQSAQELYVALGMLPR